MPENALSRFDNGEAYPWRPLSEKPTSAAELLEDALHLYLFAALDALTAQARVAGEPAYLRRYSPSQIATLHGVMADRTARMIEAFYGML